MLDSVPDPRARRGRCHALMPLLVGILGGLGAIGVIVVATGWTPAPERSVEARANLAELVMPVCVAVIGGTIALVVTGWAVAFVD